MLNLRRTVQSGNAAMLVRSYGVTPDGATVDLYTLGSETGLRVQVITYGGTIVGIEVPDRKGVRDNVILALPSLAEYLEQDAYLGALIGRFANRISGASACSTIAGMTCRRTTATTASMAAA